MRRFEDFLAEKLSDPAFAEEFWRAEAQAPLTELVRNLALPAVSRPSSAIVRLNGAAQTNGETADSERTALPQARPSAN